MTDPYDQHDHEHEEGMHPDHGDAHETPSEDEFADDHSATAEHSEEQMMSSADGEAKGRSPVLPIAAAVGGVLLLGVVAWWQLSGSDATPAPVNPMGIASNIPAPQMPDKAAAIPPTPAPVLDAAPTGNDSPTVAGTPVAAPAAPAAPIAPAPDNTLGAAASADTTNALAALSTASAPPAPVVAPAAVPAPVPVAVAPPVAPAQDAAATVAGAAMNAEQQRRIDALTAHMDDLQKSLDQITQQLGQVSNMVAANAAMHAAEPAAAAKIVTPATDMPVMSAPSEKPAPVKHAAARHAASRPKHVAHKEVAHPAPAAETAGSEESSWVLRAASPGEAWVATSPTSRELKQLHVGDRLPGIGRVTAIQQVDGTWTVKGTSGTVR